MNDQEKEEMRRLISERMDRLEASVLREIRMQHLRSAPFSSWLAIDQHINKDISEDPLRRFSSGCVRYPSQYEEVCLTAPRIEAGESATVQPTGINSFFEPYYMAVIARPAEGGRGDAACLISQICVGNRDQIPVGGQLSSAVHSDFWIGYRRVSLPLFGNTEERLLSMRFENPMQYPILVSASILGNRVLTPNPYE